MFDSKDFQVYKEINQVQDNITHFIITKKAK